MNDYLIIGADYDDEYLAHYGVLGMKWHHHKATKYISKAKMASRNAKEETKYRRDFDKEMKNEFKNKPKMSKTERDRWSDIRNKQFSQSKSAEQKHLDKASKYYKKANEHLDKNKRNADNKKTNKYTNYTTVTDEQAKRYREKANMRNGILFTAGLGAASLGAYSGAKKIISNSINKRKK